MLLSPHSAPAWTSDHPGASAVRLLRLPTPAIDALAAGNLPAARAATNIALTGFIASATCQRVWGVRSAQLAAMPSDADWVTRVVVTGDGTVVGRAGFHGAPDATGMVEVGYEIDPAHRRRGYARAALLVLLDVARAEGVRTLRATISPDNTASRTLVASHDLVETGEQWDEEDGLEIIFEVAL